MIDDAGCQVWQGERTRNSPTMWYQGRHHTVRRLRWEDAYGPLPPDQVVRCTCGTHLCVGLDHLQAMTEKQGAQLDIANGKKSDTMRRAKIAASHRARTTKLSTQSVHQIRTSS